VAAVVAEAMHPAEAEAVVVAPGAATTRA
jgi:hypothetical protein